MPTSPTVETITPGDKRLSELLHSKLVTMGASRIWFMGDIALLDQALLGFFCSRMCPGDIVLKTYDMIRRIRDANVTVIGGFHSPMEKECLELLLKGSARVVVCPARGIQRMRVPTVWREPMSKGRLLIVSQFKPKCNTVRSELAAKRNEFAASVAANVLLPHAAPNSTTMKLCRDLLNSGKRVFTIQAAANDPIVTAGANPIESAEEFVRYLC